MPISQDRMIALIRAGSLMEKAFEDLLQYSGELYVSNAVANGQRADDALAAWKRATSGASIEMMKAAQVIAKEEAHFKIMAARNDNNARRMRKRRTGEIEPKATRSAWEVRSDRALMGQESKPAKYSGAEVDKMLEKYERGEQAAKAQAPSEPPTTPGVEHRRLGDGTEVEIERGESAQGEDWTDGELL